MNIDTYFIIELFLIIVLLFFTYLLFHRFFYKKVPYGKGLLRTGRGDEKIAFSFGLYALPYVHHLVEFDLLEKKWQINKSSDNANALIFKDGTKATAVFTFMMQIKADIEGIYSLAGQTDLAKAGTAATMEHLFKEQFTAIIETVAQKHTFDELYQNRDTFKALIFEELYPYHDHIYRINDCIITSFEPVD